ncbi:hypothetical protein C8R44DRAFT_658302 [Mycena epipterygia]|nr:hypothetical protein C8R44DRAFT_658302 [Mycena epipterygia]
MDSVVPNDPLSLLPPDVAKIFELLRYVGTGSSAVFVWDVLNNFKDDYRLLSKYPVRWPVLAYFTSRILCLVYIVGFTIFLTYPARGCETLALVLDCLYPAAIPATSLLFFFRVRAIYGGKRSVTVFFGILWILEVAACMFVPFGTTGANIGPTPYCVVSRISPIDGASTITPTVFDTAVFVAISYRLIGNSSVKSAHHSWMERCRALFSGAYLPSLSRSLFVQGQVYYAITVISNIATSVMIYTHVGTGYHALLALPNITLTSVLACRVYRRTRLGLTQEQDNDTMLPSLNARRNNHATLPLNIISPARRTESDTVERALPLEQKGDITDKIRPGSIYG